MSNNTLILHHFQNYWEEGLSQYNTNFEEFNNKVMDFILNNDIDKIIVTQFEDFEAQPEHESLIKICSDYNIVLKFEEYGYGWEKDPNENPPEKMNETWCFGTREHHDEENDIILIDDWMHEIKNDNIMVAGAFEGECVSDLQAALSAIGASFENIEGLIVGSGVEYQFEGMSPEELVEQGMDLLSKIEEEIDELKEEHRVDGFRDLIEIVPQTIRNAEENLNEFLMENIEPIKRYQVGHNFFSGYDNIMDIIEYVIENECEHEDYYFETEEPLKKQLFTVLKQQEEPQVFYHGTFWEKPSQKDDIEENCFLSLKRDQSDLGVVYLANTESTADWFSGWNKAEADDESIQCVFKIKKHLNKTFEWRNGDERDVVLNGTELDIISDKEEIFKALENSYDAVIIKNNYPEFDNGDDIAYLGDIEENEIEGIKLKINNQWTEYMSPEDCLDCIENNWLSPRKRQKIKP